MRNSDDLASQCIEHIIKWLNGNIDKSNFDDYPKFQEMLAQDSADLKEKIDLFMEEGIDEF
jgi:Zn-dependent M16 (insulinase) family peptidase|tara:strand:+ start:851 stop:1033 length:183 start_codon:yes stop_codon:yes gene_type:complete